MNGRVPPDLTNSLLAARSAQILVRLHVEPHGEQHELGAGDQQQSHEDDGADGDRVAGDPQHRLDDAEQQARRQSSRSRSV